MGKPFVVRKAASPDAKPTQDAEYSRLHRVLRILNLIQNQPGWTSLKLAGQCAVTERTIFRDLQLLEGAGVPCLCEPQTKEYRVRGDFFMKPIDLTLDEALAIIALGGQIGQEDQVPFTQPAARAVEKIRGRLPENLRRELESLNDSMLIRLARRADAGEARDVYAKVRTAIARKRCLRCVYESSEKRYTKRFIFRPYKLWFDQRAWYVVGHHGGHDQVRCMKLGRFVQMEETDITFEIPKGFSLNRHLGNAWRMIRGERTYEVELIFDAKFAENIADTHWHDTQEIDWNDDGSITFHCCVDGLDEIVWWILSMGPHCVVVKPDELRQRVYELASETARAYESKTRGPGSSR